MKLKLMICFFTACAVVGSGQRSLYLVRMPINLYVTISGQGCGELSANFLIHKSETFSDKNKQVKKICLTKQKQVMSFEFNIKKLKSIQLNFKGDYRNLEIQSLKLKGKRSFDLTGVLQQKEGPAGWTVGLKNQVNVKAGYFFDGKIFFILLVLMGIVLYKLLSYVGELKNIQQKSLTDAVLVCCFFTLLFLPMLHIDDNLKSVEENRNLASYPKLKKGGLINNNVGREMDTWFSDHFFGRKFIITFYDHLLYWISPAKERAHLLVGKDGWLFSPNSGEVANFQNNNLFTEKQLASVGSYLTSIDNWCKKHNKDFYFFIAPNKSRVYPEYFPFARKVRPDSESRTVQLVNYLEKNTPVKVIYPLDDLKAKKEKELLYWKSDTHWNLLGAYYGYVALMKAMGRTDWVAVDKVKYYKRPIGDINNMYRFLPKDKEQYWAPVFPDKRDCTPENIFSQHNELICQNANKTERVVMFRDSFASALLEYLSRSFGKISAYWYHQLTPQDLENIKNNADIVIFEKVERHLHHLTSFKFVGD